MSELENKNIELEEEHTHEHEHEEHDHHDHEVEHHYKEHDHEHEKHEHHEHDHHHDEHVHKHTEECGCDHDHEHEDHDHHEHVHGPGCSCGCDHDHDHDHEGHDHEHDHGTQYTVEGYRLVETHTHEGATVCSFERDVHMTPDEAKTAMEEAFIAIENWLNAQGAIIGHVKGYIKEFGPSTTFSTVGAGTNITEHAGGGASVGFASIVFGPDEVTMKDKVIEEFSRLR